ncbi:protein KTI12 homolog [Bacillus rossius redtenbacheri]|uniref:protein KTI12 homolog n=1 Tax=Bacillus rossius redtenbacheri TaxID=93214 RepID=UPI002FDD9A59
MPLVVVTGFPSSGKTTRSLELKSYLEDSHNCTVHVISENVVLKNSGKEKNAVVFDSGKEKEVRGLIKAETQRLIGRETVVIIDAGNYIKGFRYELYCMSKASKCTQCTLHCVVPVETARGWNAGRAAAAGGGDDGYSAEAFDALVARYEPPDSRSRWDAPLFSPLPGDELPGPEMFAALYGRKPPPPNMSTQCAPLSSTNFLYELDRITQEIVTAVLSAQKLGAEGRVQIPGHEGLAVEGVGPGVTPAQLARLRRQFLSYTRLHPVGDAAAVPPLFAQFLNASLR